MKFNRSVRIFLALCFLILGVGFSSAQAGDVEITRSFSGIWDQPDHQSQGFVLQIAEGKEEDSKIGVVYWFTYDDDLTPHWYLGVGPVEGGQILMKLYAASGIAFLETGFEGNPNVEEIGTLVFDFQNCNQGVAIFETPQDVLGTGEVRIKRLTSLYKMRCSGGISDDVPGHAKPEQLEVALLPPDEGEGKGKAKFWERPGRSDLKVTVEGLPDGEYHLQVCEDEELVFPFQVAEGEGNVQFRSPKIPSKELLDFNPRDCRFDILEGDLMVLTSGEEVLAPKAKGPKDDEGNGSDNDNEIEIDLENTGVINSAKGTASFESDDDRDEFKVKIMDVPVGDYPLHVNGAEVGVIEVEEHPGKNRGELRFSDPQKEGDHELLFEPLGKIIEVYSGAEVILEVIFPDA